MHAEARSIVFDVINIFPTLNDRDFSRPQLGCDFES
jgi:hypothetical protein